ncbi:alpha/beta hydrolase [[Mycobacterium] crassicus]|uniref:Alpha/beta hydrolase n=1 Tax=[Mycobacterium] crassicus TaxID=2872309 RepID=A0ABU5XFK9_9MYCO|nr:alpha/beta hydrolase [Mycolicibacter sp. MYC098]MEB3019931.1 alpha/beta hydrolase [Mycolicibacter sp. MYC098]
MITRGLRRRVHRRRSAQSVAVSLTSRFFVKNLVRAWAVRPDLAWPFASVDRFAALVPYDGTVEVRRIRLGRCVAERIQTTGASTQRAILYLHGGAFFTCGLNTHRSLAARLSREANACVLNIDYRMLPSHRMSDAIDDALSGFRWLLRRGYEPEQIVVAGDSAGGYLAFMTVLAAQHSEKVRPAGIAVISPFTDANPATKLCHRNASRCAMFPGGALSVFTRYLLRARAASPVDADLSSLPPVTIHVSSDELLLPDAEIMAQRLDAAGVRCDLHLWDGQIHDFPLAADVLPEGRRAIRYIGEFVKEVTEDLSGPDLTAA